MIMFISEITMLIMKALICFILGHFPNDSNLLYVMLEINIKNLLQKKL